MFFGHLGQKIFNLSVEIHNKAGMYMPFNIVQEGFKITMSLYKIVRGILVDRF